MSLPPPRDRLELRGSIHKGVTPMTVVVLFCPSAMIAEQYNEVTKCLEAAGARTPASRVYHVCFVYRLRVLGQWFDGIRFYAAASSPRRSRRTWAGLR